MQLPNRSDCRELPPCRAEVGRSHQAWLLFPPMLLALLNPYWLPVALNFLIFRAAQMKYTNAHYPLTR